LFSIYPVDSVDQAIALLAGNAAAAVNRLAVARLKAMLKWAGHD
jgi:hypothetical protein